MTDPNTPVTALRPCPFVHPAGSPHPRIGSYVVIPGIYEAQVYCQVCAINGPKAQSRNEAEARTLAAERWNARPAPVGGVEGLLHEAAEALVDLTDVRPCELHLGNGYCMTHSQSRPCSHPSGLAVLEKIRSHLSRLSPEPVGGPSPSEIEFMTDVIQMLDTMELILGEKTGHFRTTADLNFYVQKIRDKIKKAGIPI